jgi:signal transduction histidine kinase
VGYLACRCRPSRASWLAALFSVFLFVCGTIHLLTSWGFWQPDYRLDACMKLLAAVLSLAGAGLLWHLIIRSIREPRQSTAQLQLVIRQLEHEVIERKHAEQELQKSRELLRELAAYQEKVKEDERKRIAREIHDELGQNLLALRIDVSMLHARTSNAHPKLNEKVRYVLAHIDSSIKAVRAIINNLRPSVLDLGLHAAIEWQVKEFERRTGIECKLSMDDNKTDYELDDHRATALFRILQESLTNVARHAQATLVLIELHRDGGRYVMKITDNGVGIFPGCRRKPNSFGLLGIGERISTLGGEFNVDSLPGEGTTLTMSIPAELAVAAS